MDRNEMVRIAESIGNELCEANIDSPEFDWIMGRYLNWQKLITIQESWSMEG